MAEQSPFAELPIFTGTLPRFPDIEICRIPGRHHFHLEGAAAEIAARLRRFLDAPPGAPRDARGS
jgi:hypothetical protein